MNFSAPVRVNRLAAARSADPLAGTIRAIHLAVAEKDGILTALSKLALRDKLGFPEAFAELGTEPRLVVNLSSVQFMDSAGLGALIGGIRKVRENDGRIAVFCDRANITRLLHTTGFDRIVPVKEDLGEAVSALDDDPS